MITEKKNRETDSKEVKAKTREISSNKQSKKPDSSTDTHRPAHPREKKKIHTLWLAYLTMCYSAAGPLTEMTHDGSDTLRQ